MAANTDKRDKPLGLGEFLFNELRGAMRDARQKLIDEGWFGRRSASNTQTEGHSMESTSPIDPSEAFYGRRPTFEERWAVREPPQEKAAYERGLDIDR